MSVRPADFSGENPPARPIGTECEYNLQVPDNAAYGIDEFVGPVPLYEHGIPNHYGFLGSDYGGGHVGVDVGHVEFSTREVLGPAKAAVEDIKGIGRVATIIDKAGLAHEGLYRIGGSYIPNGRVAISEMYNEDGYTSGYHRSLLFPRQVADDTLTDRLMATAMAVQFWAGSGGVLHNKFAFSQKIWGCGGPPVEHSDMERRTTPGEKPMALIPPSDFEGDTISQAEWARFEVRMNDPGLSLVNSYLAYAAISLSLRLVEQQARIGRERLNDACLTDPVTAAHFYNGDLSLTHRSETIAGESVTALDGQERLIDLFETLQSEVALPKDEVVAISGLRALIDTLRQCRPNKLDYTALALARTNFAAKHRFVMKVTPGKNAAAAILQRNLLWDRVLPEGNGQHYWAVMTEKDPLSKHVRVMANEAPEIKRAALRSRIVDGVASGLAVHSWAQYSDENNFIYSLGDPIGE